MSLSATGFPPLTHEEGYACTAWTGTSTGASAWTWLNCSPQAPPLYWASNLDQWPLPTLHPNASFTPSTDIASTPSVRGFEPSREHKGRCRLGFVVYRLGPGMFHSGVVINNSDEWHFWEGTGIRRLPRPYWNGQHYPAVSHLHIVEDSDVGWVDTDVTEIEDFCRNLGQVHFNVHTYDLLRNNCNHYVSRILERFGKLKYLPSYVNRSANIGKIICALVPGAQQVLDHLLGR